MFGGARTTAWTEFLKATAGKGMTIQEKSALYRQTHNVRRSRSPSRCAGLSKERCATTKNCKANKNGRCYTTVRRPRRSHCAGLRDEDCLKAVDCKANKNGVCYTTKRRSRRSASPSKRSASPAKRKPRSKPTAAQKAAGAAKLAAARQAAIAGVRQRSIDAAVPLRLRALAARDAAEDRADAVARNRATVAAAVSDEDSDDSEAEYAEARDLSGEDAGARLDSLIKDARAGRARCARRGGCRS